MRSWWLVAESATAPGVERAFQAILDVIALLGDGECHVAVPLPPYGTTYIMFVASLLYTIHICAKSENTSLPATANSQSLDHSIQPALKDLSHAPTNATSCV